MAQTPPSLLNRLREHPDDADAWRRFDDLYRPLLLAWLRRYAVRPHDAEDLLQEVLHTVVRKLPGFQYDPARGKFRSWLRAILVNHLRAFLRSERGRPLTGDGGFYEQVLNQLADPASDLSRLWDEEHDRHVYQRLLAQIRPDFSPDTWEAFRRLVAGEEAKSVAADLGMSVNAVYLARSRVVRRLREGLEGLAD